MKKPVPNLPDQEAQNFAFSVGKAIQNFGTIEYLANEILTKLISDKVLHKHVISQPISKRVELILSLSRNDSIEIESAGIKLADLKNRAQRAFQNRNKIAHNPLVVKEENSNLTIGIHVIRYGESGNSEEWIKLSDLESMVIDSQNLMLQFNALLGVYMRKTKSQA